ncbi:transporter substrate-binding domain-containing protein [Deinococcus detaillensis]|uniref:Transporter substrate-binding domain-containing protein n=1 Tax=Deinococcus detaillensis TaxID=2592048 RepID=A0A553V205_9DEIO|nr:TAXI family TRAP transporter solute-binding subunit [Deinococcus detaillensis]TSA86480.1 transporter substrate-binding domain-containing protein [Deinococcus detaillensis]
MKRFALACALLTGAAFAQTPSAQPLTVLNVATGSKGGTYATMYKNLGDVCTSASWLRERQTSGSVESVDLLLSNQVSLAFVQLDVLKARDQIDGDARAKGIRTLLALHQEELHLIAKKPTKNFFGRLSGVTSYSQLAGKKLGAWGGSVVTANVLRAKAGVSFQVVSFPTREAALSALSAGTVDAVLAAVGQPADWVKALDAQQYSLLPLDIDPSKIKDFYQKAKLIYPQFGASVDTYSVQSLLVTRDFKTPEKRAQLLKYQACARNKLTRLQEDEGMHPKWNDVTFKSAGWPDYK